MSWYSLFNNIEGLLWLFVAGFVFVKTPYSTRQQQLSINLATLGFLAFGLTDFLEANYEAHVPLWLYALKISCGTAIFISRYTWKSWNRFRFTDREFLFAIFCLAAVTAIIIYQQSLP